MGDVEIAQHHVLPAASGRRQPRPAQLPRETGEESHLALIADLGSRAARPIARGNGGVALRHVDTGDRHRRPGQIDLQVASLGDERTQLAGQHAVVFNVGQHRHRAGRPG